METIQHETNVEEVCNRQQCLTGRCCFLFTILSVNDDDTGLLLRLSNFCTDISIFEFVFNFCSRLLLIVMNPFVLTLIW